MTCKMPHKKAAAFEKVAEIHYFCELLKKGNFL